MSSAAAPTRSDGGSPAIGIARAAPTNGAAAKSTPVRAAPSVREART